MTESVDDVYANLIKVGRFKARYSTRGSGVFAYSDGYISVDIAVDMSASLDLSTTSREVVDGVCRWAFEGTYRFAENRKTRGAGLDIDDKESLRSETESSGTASVAVKGYLEAGKTTKSAVLRVCLDQKPLERLTVTSHEMMSGDSDNYDTTEARPHPMFFEAIEVSMDPSNSLLDLPAVRFRSSSFTDFRSWQTKTRHHQLGFAFVGDLEVIFHQEIAITDGDILPTDEDCVPLIEVLEESGNTPVEGKEFKILHPDGSLSTHVSDAKGQVRLYVRDGEEYVVKEMQEHLDKNEAHHQKTEVV